MVTRILIIIYLFAFYTVSSQSWNRIDLSKHGNVKGIFFNADTGLVITYNGSLINTTTYFKQYSVDSSYQGNVFNDFSFSDSGFGYISCPTISGGLLRTINYGNTWTIANLSNQLPFNDFGTTVSFVNPYTVVGGYNYHFEVVKSKDAGSTRTYFPVNPACAAIFKIRFINDSTGYALGTDHIAPYGNLILFKSNNQGIDWQALYVFNETGVGDLLPINDSVVYVLSAFSAYRSTDFGNSFNKIFNQFSPDNTIMESANNLISIVGQDTIILAFSRGLYRSFNGGASWQPLNIPLNTTESIVTSKLVDDMHYLIGTDFGNIYVDTSGFLLNEWSMIEGNIVLKDLFVHPNPATTTITLNGTEPGSTATITNLHGQVLLQLTVNSQQQSINIEHLPPGMYFCMVQTGGQHKVLRFVRE